MLKLNKWMNKMMSTPVLEEYPFNAVFSKKLTNYNVIAVDYSFGEF